MSLLSSSTQKRKPMKNKRQKEKEPLELPLDVLSVIAKKLDIDDLFSFGQVCKNWRMIHSDFWCNFMASDSPLILQKTTHAKRSCFFYSIHNSTTYKTLLPCFSGFSFAGFSSGYMIMIGHRSDLLINPFTRKTIKIPKPYDLFQVKHFVIQAMLAFDAKNSAEFIIVVLTRCKVDMIVYQSRNSNWAIYSRNNGTSSWNVIDVVVFQNTIYAITVDAEIGIVMLKPQRLKFLNLKNKPFNYRLGFLKFVVGSNDDDDDDQLLVVYNGPRCFEIFMVDFCTMTWIKLKTLGDRALFSVRGSKCYSLSDPCKWGFRRNCLYYINHYSPRCEVLSMDKEVIEIMLIPQNLGTTKAKVRNIGWCFRRQCDVVDYSNLVE